jgi:pimeloyl-ACP methyl ester carboxylesterase
MTMQYKDDVAGEKLIWIDLPDTNGLKIKGILQGTIDKPVAIIVHGRPGTPEAHAHTQTGEYFNKHGISSLRLFMYSSEINTRSHDDTNLNSYSKDFETVVSYLRAHETPKLFGIGHSYGGLAILNSKVAIDAAVLWDPTHGSYWVEYPGIKHTTIKPLTEFEAMGDTTALAAHKGYPIKIISAGRGKMIDYHKRYIAVADEPKAQSVLAGAQHNLGNTLQILDELRQQTIEWLIKFM